MLNFIFNKFRRLIVSGETYAKTAAIEHSRNLGVKVGKDCRFYSSNFSSEPYLIEIGNHVTITEGVRFITHDGAAWVIRGLDNSLKNVNILGNIKIGNNVFIGNNAIILPGVTIGDNTVIAASSVVSKSFEGNEVIAGVPAKSIKPIYNYVDDNKPYFVNTKQFNAEEKREFILDRMDDTKLKRK